MRKFIYPLFLIFLASCTTTQDKNLKLVPEGDPFYSQLDKMHKLCFQSPHSQFLVDFSSLNSGADFQMEGAWKNDFNTLTIDVLGPFGDTYATLEVDHSKIIQFLIQNKQFQNDEMENLKKMIGSIGSKGLRSLFCGTYSFPEGKRNFLYKKEMNLQENLFYFAKNTMDVEGHSIDVQSDFNPMGAYLKISSEFSSFWSWGSQMHFQWDGRLEEKKLSPQTLSFKNKEMNFFLKFLDFE